MQKHKLSPSEQLGRLIGEVQRTWRTRLNEQLRPLGLSQTRWLTLRILARNQQLLSQVELANRLGVEPATLVAVLDGLTRDGYIERRSSTSDRRMKSVHLTAKSENMLHEIEATASKLRKQVMQGLKQEQIQAAVATLESIRVRLQAIPATDATSPEITNKVTPKKSTASIASRGQKRR